MYFFLLSFPLPPISTLFPYTTLFRSIAIPAYQDYTIRSKVTECLNAAGVCKTSIAEYYQSKRSVEHTSELASPMYIVSRHFSAPENATGNITVKAINGLGNQLSGADV